MVAGWIAVSIALRSSGDYDYDHCAECGKYLLLSEHEHKIELSFVNIAYFCSQECLEKYKGSNTNDN